MNSYWIDSTIKEGMFDTLNNNISCDVCIIGAGMFGLTTAYYLSQKGLNVVILDKSAIGTKVSGHTTAKITSQHGIIYDYLINSFGLDIAKKYLNANEEAIKNIKSIIENEKIECDFKEQSNFVYTTKQDDVEKIEKELSALKLLDFHAQQVNQTQLPFDITSAIMFPNQAKFHPRKYMLGLCNSILKNSSKIYTDTIVYDIKLESNGFITYTKNNKIKSKYVVLASHYPIINFPGFYFAKMYQETSYIIAVDTQNKLFDGMYISASSPKYSFRTAKIQNKDILLLGGANHKTGKENVSTLSTYDILEKKAKELYPDSEILYKWNTRDCITLDKIPYIGEFSYLMPNMYIGTGFNKWGITTSNVAANIITDNILGIKSNYQEAFTSTRLKPIKNIEEMKNMLKQTTTSLILDKFKIPTEKFNNIEKNTGKIIEIDGNKIGIYKNADNQIFAVKPNCSHLGCLLSWNNIDKTWDCPCHGSRFNHLGKNIYNPAIKDLETYNL